MTTTLHIFPLSEVQERANDADATIHTIEIATGHNMPGTRSGQKLIILNIRRNNDGSWPTRSFSTLEKYSGQYTATFKPGKETLFLDSRADDPEAIQQSYSMNGNSNEIAQYQGSKDVLTLVEKIIKLEKKVTELQAELDDKTEELKQFQSSGDRLTYVINNLAKQWAPQMFGAIQKNVTQPMQGTNYTEEDMSWQTQPVNNYEDAIQVIYDALGDDLLVKVARALQKDPTLAQKLEMFI